MAATITVLFISYLLGSTPSAIWVGKAFKGIDVREHGSGNAGTTNTFRVLGVPFGVMVFVLDFMNVEQVRQNDYQNFYTNLPFYRRL